MKKSIRAFVFVAVIAAGAALSGCSANYLDVQETRFETAKRLAAPSFMFEREIVADPFVLTTWERIHEKGGDATVYIEGDGVAWISKKEPSLDPTPRNPVSLHLATRDTSKNVIYLARPCQYSKLADEEKPCPMEYWTSGRFAPEVIKSVSMALDNIKARYDIHSFNLVGFSGGAAVAALVAAQRTDVATLRTVAGNLDHARLNQNHGVSAMEGSLNPAAIASQLANLPQHHFVSEWDEVVTPDIYDSYRTAMGPSTCSRSSLVREADHETGWVSIWPVLLKKPVDCSAQ